MPNQIINTCILCQTPLFDHLLRFEDEEALFCCKGCQIVYQILKAQGALAGYQQHPVFQQALAAGLITNPNFLIKKEIEEEVFENEYQKLHLVIDDMWCPSCALVIHLILLKEEGIRGCVVDYSTDLAVIDYTPRKISKDKIFRIIHRLGYRPSLLKDPRSQAISRSLLLRFVVAAFFSLNVMMFAYPIYATYFDGDTEGYATLFAWLSFWGSLPVITYSGWPIWRRFFSGLRVGVWGMEALVFIGVFSATALSMYVLFTGSPYVYFDSLTVIITFVLLGKMIESKAKFSAKDALVNLSLALPRRGRKRLITGEECFVSIKEIAPNDLVVVRMGEKIVIDGIVEEGSGACDESLMTGESLPVSKEKGSKVLAGSILQQGWLTVKATGHFEETALHHIMEMVGKEIEHKSRYVRSADAIVKWFIPLVIVMAIFTGFYCWFFAIHDPEHTVFETAIIRAISLLLISCPCAIGIAAPLAEAYLLNFLAKSGVIIRNRGALAFLGKETVYVFDKTGTITQGVFTVRSGLEQLTFDEQRILKGLTALSGHPLSIAIHSALLCPPYPLQKVEEIVGKGLKGMFDGKTYYLGSFLFIQEQGIDLPFEEKNKGSEILTSVYFGKTRLQLGDKIREGVVECLALLSSKRTILLSGDGESSVEKVAQLCGFSEWRAGCHPLEKRKMIEELKQQGEVVAMFGDGMNDAPALTAAQVGVAVVSASDLSIQVSDLLLTTPRFDVLNHLYEAAARGRRIVKQNLFWAFFYNCVGLLLAMSGLLSPLFAAFAMVASSLIVLFNARRLKDI